MNEWKYPPTNGAGINFNEWMNEWKYPPTNGAGINFNEWMNAIKMNEELNEFMNNSNTPVNDCEWNASDHHSRTDVILWFHYA